MRRIKKLFALGVIGVFTASLSAAVPTTGEQQDVSDPYWWCAEFAGFAHEDWDDEEELPGGGPFYKAVAPQDKHSNGIFIGSPCWDDGDAESHTEYQPS